MSRNPPRRRRTTGNQPSTRPNTQIRRIATTKVGSATPNEVAIEHGPIGSPPRVAARMPEPTPNTTISTSVYSTSSSVIPKRGAISSTTGVLYTKDVPKSSGQHRADPVQVLDPHRLIEVVLRLDRGDHLGRGPQTPGEGDDRVAGGEQHRREDDDARQEQRQQEPAEPARELPDRAGVHRRPFSSSVAAVTRRRGAAPRGSRTRPRTSRSR